MSALILMVGAPGAGKSTWIANSGLSPYSLSLDTLRCMYTGREDDFTCDSACVRTLHDMAAYRFSRKDSPLTVIDNTNYRADYRKPLIEMARMANLPVIAVVFNVNGMECKRRDGLRGNKIKDDGVIPRFWAGVLEAMVTLPGEVDTVVTINSIGAYTVTGAGIPQPLRDQVFAGLDSGNPGRKGDQP